MNPYKVIVIGAGSRGQRYTNIMAEQPERFKVVGVAEPIDARREYVRDKHGIPEENCHKTWETILSVPKFADIACICTMDQMHMEPAVKAMELGYDLLLEKPIANSKEECAAVYKAAEKYGRKVMVCHVLRYTPYFKQLKKFIDDGILGEVIAVSHLEAVGNVHQSHSFVRGNWGKESDSSFMLLQKCCHDVDILQWLLGKNCEKVQSFGSLQYFTEKNAPEGAPERCHEGCPVKDCPYNAVKLYYDDKNNDWFRNAASGKVGPTDEEIMEALKTTQYGKCVFKCDNDVVDHQTVNMVFEGGTTVTLTMAAFNQGGRKTHIMGTKGELYADMKAEEKFRFYDFATSEWRSLTGEEIAIAGDSITSGHGGGDQGIVGALYLYESGELDKSQVSEIGISYANHMLTFAAEDARKSGKVIDFTTYID